MTKVDKFKPAKNKKAYSYFGTICKNYLMGQIQKDQKETNRKVSYEDISQALENRPDMVYYLEFEKIDAEKIIDIFLKDLKDHVKNTSMADGEFKLGNALIELFENYGNIFKTRTYSAPVFDLFKNDSNNQKNECVEITDEFAIDFADWIRVCKLKERSYDFDNIEELLKTYKEEKGL
jgi:hypothetical protein